MDITTAEDLGTHASEYDALADLFLSEDAPASFKHPAAKRPAAAPAAAQIEKAATPRPVTIEGVIAGHLPVLASAWVTQYGRHTADALREPVVLLRVSGANLWLDVVMPSGARVPQDAAAAPGESLEAILERTASRWRHWLIRVDAPSEPDLLSLRGLSRVSLLTGADDVAVLGSYQAIKGLAQQDREGDGADAAALQLVIMGSHQEKAGEAEAKLRRAVRQFLGKDIEPALRIGKIGASLSVQLFRGQKSLELADVVRLIETAKQPAAPTIAAVPSAPRNSAPSANSAFPSMPADFQNAHVAQVAKSAPAPEAASTPIPNLQPLPATCPYAPGVQLAAGADGRLHLIIQTHCKEVVSGVGEACKRLLTAAAWAHDHAQLLAAACPQLSPGASDPVLHLVTDDAREARPLLDTGMRVHLALRVDVDGRKVWAYSDLN